MTMATDNMLAPAPVSYMDVAILRPGRYRDMQGRSVEFCEEELRRIAASYDPRYHSATLNTDHADSGPALGHITALRYSGGHLRADIAGLPAWFCRELQEGRWPARSAEIWRDLDGRGPYLRGLAFLGARAPAVRGLPPLPAPSPAMATHQPSALISILMEGDMDSLTNTVDQPAIERLSAENRRLQTELAGHQRRAAENGVDELLAELRGSGRLSPGMEGRGLRELLIALAGDTEHISLADGDECSRFECLAGLLQSLPAQDYGTELSAGADEHVQLSAFEQEIAASLGLTDTEYSQIRDARTA